ncbi:amidohydrolase family protein [Micromonosporaceae bacterium Da 78-11]
MTGLIDLHAHFVTDDYVRAAIAAGHELPDGMPGWPQWSAPAHLELMDRHGIDRSMLSISSPGVHFGDDDAAAALAVHVNDAAAEVVRGHPDRFGFLATLPLPDVGAAFGELRRAFDELGAGGVIVESNLHGLYLGDPLLEPVYAELDRRHAVLLVHPTSPPGWPALALGRPRPMLEFLFDSTRTIFDLLLAGVLDRHPNLRVVVPHGGALLPLLADRVQMFRAGAPGPTTRDYLRRLWFDTAGTPFPTQIPTLTGVVGTDHLVYGSDFCWTPATGVAAQVASIDADSPDWRELTTRNARRLLSVDQRADAAAVAAARTVGDNAAAMTA